MSSEDRTASQSPAQGRAAAEPHAELAGRNHGERELKMVLADLVEHSQTLARQELALLKAEYEARLSSGKAALRDAAMSFGLFYAAYLTILATLVLLLAQWTPPWVASLIVAVAASGGAVLFTWLGKQAYDAATELPKHNPSQRLGQHSPHARRTEHGY